MTEPDVLQPVTAEEELNRLDSDRLDFYIGKLEAFIERIKPGDAVLINTHPDADGLAAAAFVKKYLERKFGSKIYIDLSFNRLSSEEFHEEASSYHHVISCDQWIDNEREKQEGLRELIRRGKNILILDHHDKYFNNIDPSDPGLVEMPYDPMTPETIPHGLGEGSYDRFSYVSPTRLGAEIPSSKFPAGVLTYRLLRTIDPRVEHQRHLVPIAVLGDGASAAWGNLLKQYNGEVQRALEVADIANLASNLRDPGRLVHRFLRSRVESNSSPYDKISKSRDISGLKRIQDLIERMVEDILTGRIQVQKMGNGNGSLYYHVGDADEALAGGLVRVGTIKNPPDLDNGLATGWSRKQGGESTVVVTQFERRAGAIKGVRIRFRDERRDEAHSMIPLAEKFEGSGHDMASVAIVPATDGNAQEVLRKVQGRLANLFNYR